MTPLPPLVFIDLPLLSGATVSVRIDQIVSISDETPRPADRGLPARAPARRARVTTTGSRETVVAWSREEILTAIRAAARAARAAHNLDFDADIRPLTTKATP